MGPVSQYVPVISACEGWCGFPVPLRWQESPCSRFASVPLGVECVLWGVPGELMSIPGGVWMVVGWMAALAKEYSEGEVVVDATAEVSALAQQYWSLYQRGVRKGMRYFRDLWVLRFVFSIQGPCTPSRLHSGFFGTEGLLEWQEILNSQLDISFNELYRSGRDCGWVWLDGGCPGSV